MRSPFDPPVEADDAAPDQVDSANSTSPDVGDLVELPAGRPDDALFPVVAFSNIEPLEIEWLWEGRIAFGMITIFESDPGVGKSTIACDLAARVSMGAAMPMSDGGRLPLEPFNILFVSTEEDPARVLRPRLEAMGADLSRVMLLGGDKIIRFPDDTAILQERIVAYNVRFLIIDSLFGVMGRAVDSNRDESARTMLTPLARLAAETGCAFLFIRHLNKGSSSHTVHRGMGSTAIGAMARSILQLFKPDPEDRSCFLAQGKSNIGRIAPTIRFEIEQTREDVGVVRWKEEVNETAYSLNRRMVANTAPSEGPRDRAKLLLERELRAAPVLVIDLYEMAAEQDISSKTLDRASREVGVVKSRRSDGRWEWSL